MPYFCHRPDLSYGDGEESPPSAGTSKPVELSREQAGPTAGVPPVSSSAPPGDQMSIAASKGEPDFSGEEDLSALPPCGRPAVPDSDPGNDGYALDIYCTPLPRDQMG